MTTTPMLSRTAELEQRTFRSLLAALSRPGTVEQLPAGRTEDGPWQGPLSIAQTLLDHEVTFHVLGAPERVGEQMLRRTGARTAAPDRAAYLFAAAADGVDALRIAAEGPLEEPERSATVVLLCDAIGDGDVHLLLSGPGINDEARLALAGVDAQAFAVRSERNSPFPTGIDLVLVDPAGRVAGLPRSTEVEVIADAGRDA